MRKFAVAFANFDDKELKIKIVSYPTNNWYECLISAFPNEISNFEFSENIDEVKEDAINAGFMFEVIEISD